MLRMKKRYRLINFICLLAVYKKLIGTGRVLGTSILRYDPRHEVCSDLVDNPDDRFAHDAAHINQRFFRICATFLYIGKGFAINTTLVVIL